MKKINHVRKLKKKKEVINTGRILYRYNKDKAKSLSKVEKKIETSVILKKIHVNLP